MSWKCMMMVCLNNICHFYLWMVFAVCCPLVSSLAGKSANFVYGWNRYWFAVNKCATTNACQQVCYFLLISTHWKHSCPKVTRWKRNCCTPSVWKTSFHIRKTGFIYFKVEALLTHTSSKDQMPHWLHKIFVPRHGHFVKQNTRKKYAESTKKDSGPNFDLIEKSSLPFGLMNQNLTLLST